MTFEPRRIAATAVARGSRWETSRTPRPPRQGATQLRALAAAVVLHAAIIAALLWIGVSARPPEPPPEIAIMLEVAPAPQTASPEPSQASTPPASPPAPAPEPPPVLQPSEAAPEASPEEKTQPPEPTPQPPAPEPPMRESPPPVQAIPPQPTPPPTPAPEPAPAPRTEAPAELPAPPAIEPAPSPTSVPELNRPAEPARKPAPHRTEHPPRPSARATPAAPSPAPRTEQPASPAPTAAAPSAPAPSRPDPSWQGALSAWLQAHKHYPEAARQRGEEGTAAVRFTVARDGHVVSATVARSSGVPALDAAAVAMFKDAHVPPFPPSMQQAEITVTLALHYALEQ